MNKNKIAGLAGCFMLAACVVYAEEVKPDPEKVNVTFGGFIDTYYGYDFNNPPNIDRSYTTQPARSNEFNVNLAYVEAKANSDFVRGRLALQAGTSVQSNYAGEPMVGSVSGPSLSRNIQEAVAGVKLSDRLWVDAGIYLSHIGCETFISKDNWTYTRSLMADYSPYYETGVKASMQWSDTVSTQLHVLNGWQNISENNGNKALGMQFAYAPSEKFSFTYNNFFGNEVGNQSRLFNDFIFKGSLSEKLSLAAMYDIGLQKNPDNSTTSVWQTYALLLHDQITPAVALTLRGEQYLDRHQIIVSTLTPNGFQVVSTSLNADITIHKNVMWRTEVREYWSKDAIYPCKMKGLALNDGLAVSSLSFWF